MVDYVRGPPRPLVGSVIYKNDTKDSEKLLYSRLWFISVKEYQSNQLKEKAVRVRSRRNHRVRSRRNQAQAFKYLLPVLFHEYAFNSSSKVV